MHKIVTAFCRIWRINTVAIHSVVVGFIETLDE